MAKGPTCVRKGGILPCTFDMTGCCVYCGKPKLATPPLSSVTGRLKSSIPNVASPLLGTLNVCAICGKPGGLFCARCLANASSAILSNLGAAAAGMAGAAKAATSSLSSLDLEELQMVEMSIHIDNPQTVSKSLHLLLAALVVAAGEEGLSITKEDLKKARNTRLKTVIIPGEGLLVSEEK